MLVVGVDLAWGEGDAIRTANETGVVAIDESGRVVDAGWTIGIDETVEWVSSRADQDTLAMIDAPLVVSNTSGQRVCETAVGRSYGRWKVSANSTNRSSPRLAGLQLGRRLESLGWTYDAGWTGPMTSGRRLSECYPYATLVGAHELGYDHERPAYKRRPNSTPVSAFRALRADVCCDLIGRLADLHDADPPLLLVSHPVTARLVAEPSPMNDAAYKHREDLIDALICAWTGSVWLRHGLARCQVLGDELADPRATIIAPARTSQRRRSPSMVTVTRDDGPSSEHADTALPRPLGGGDRRSTPDSRTADSGTESAAPDGSSAAGQGMLHDCRCAVLPATWPKCGKQTKSVWSPGCDGRSLDAALRSHGFATRTEFIDWAARSPTLSHEDGF